MSTGGPRLPESGWNIDYEQAFNSWLRSYRPNLPPASWVTGVTEWIQGCKLAGPPVNARLVDEDRYIAQIPGTRLFAEYLVIDYEFLILVKDIH